MNNDGAVDSKDAVIVLKAYAEQLATNKVTVDVSIGDVNGDKKVDSKDAVLILKYYAENLAGAFKGSMADYVKNISK